MKQNFIPMQMPIWIINTSAGVEEEKTQLSFYGGGNGWLEASSSRSERIVKFYL